MNALFTEKKYESSYVCIAASILGRSKNGHPQNRSNKEATRELLAALILFIVLTNNEEEAATEQEEVNEKRSQRSLLR
jgi:hypothetical protein